MEKIKVACYCRVSTKSESQASSLENQQAFFYQFIERNPQFELYRIYKDEGISAKSIIKRREFQQMVKEAKENCFSKILVKDISRFARNTVDFLETIRELKQYGVTVEFITYNMESLGNSEFVLTVLAAIAQEESCNLSIKSKFGKKLAAQKGAVPSVVYGYDNPGGRSYQLLLNSVEAKTVEKIFYLYTEKQYGSYSIAKLLTEENIPTKKYTAKGWQAQTIDRILQNPLYTGRICNGKTEIKNYLLGEIKKNEKEKWIILEQPSLRIISDEVFEKAQIIRSKRVAKNPIMRSSIKHPLSNLLICAIDGTAFRRKTKKNSRFVYWVCSKRDKMGSLACENKVYIEEKQMHSLLLKFLMNFKEEVLYEQFEIGMERILTKKSAQKENQNELYLEKTRLLKERKKLIELYVSDVADKNYLKIELIPVERRLKEIEVLLLKIENKFYKKEQIEKAKEKLKEKIKNNSANVLENGFLKSIFQKFIVYPNGTITVIFVEEDETMISEIPFAVVKEDFFYNCESSQLPPPQMLQR